MYIDLQSQTTIFAVHAVALVLGAVVAFRYYSRQGVHKADVLLTGVILLVVAGGYVALRMLYPRDSFPLFMVAWALPFAVTLAIALRTSRSPKNSVLSWIAAVFCLVLFVLLVNNHFGVYKTIPPIQQKKTATQSVQSASAVPFESYYHPQKEIPKNGTITPLTIPSSAGFSPREGRIYLPPAVQGNGSLRLPVIVLLAGYPGGPLDWESLGVASIMDDFAARHKGLAPIVVLADHGGKQGLDTECVNSKFGAVETYLVKDVPNYLKEHYQVDHHVNMWTVAGYSAGGMCSAMLAIRNSGVYKNFMNLTGETHPSYGNTETETIATLFGGSRAAFDAHDTMRLLQKHDGKYKKMNGYFVIGIDDSIQLNASIEGQQILAEKAGMSTQLLKLNGGHTGGVWTEGYKQGLEWIMSQISFTTKK